MTMVTVFLDPTAHARGGAGGGSPLYVYDSGRMSTSVTLQFKSDTPSADQVRAAEAVLRGVEQWRDSIVAAAEAQRTAVDELAESRAEIARLRAELAGGEL